MTRKKVENLLFGGHLDPGDVSIFLVSPLGAFPGHGSIVWNVCAGLLGVELIFFCH